MVWKNPNDTSDGVNGWNYRLPKDSTLGRYVWLSEIVVVGQCSSTDSPKRDWNQVSTPYGNTGARAPGTITGGQAWDKMTGGIKVNAHGSRINNCVLINSGMGSIGVSSSILDSDIHLYGNLTTHTGHSGNDGRDHGHNAYIQWRSDAKRLTFKHTVAGLKRTVERSAVLARDAEDRKVAAAAADSTRVPLTVTAATRRRIETNAYLAAGLALGAVPSLLPTMKLISTTKTAARFFIGVSAPTMVSCGNLPTLAVTLPSAPIEIVWPCWS